MLVTTRPRTSTFLSLSVKCSEQILAYSTLKLSARRQKCNQLSLRYRSLGNAQKCTFLSFLVLLLFAQPTTAQYTVDSRFNDLVFNEYPGLTNKFRSTGRLRKHVIESTSDLTNSRFNERLLRIPGNSLNRESTVPWSTELIRLLAPRSHHRLDMRIIYMTQSAQCAIRYARKNESVCVFLL